MGSRQAASTATSCTAGGSCWASAWSQSACGGTGRSSVTIRAAPPASRPSARQPAAGREWGGGGEGLRAGLGGLSIGSNRVECRPPCLHGRQRQWQGAPDCWTPSGGWQLKAGEYGSAAAIAAAVAAAAAPAADTCADVGAGRAALLLNGCPPSCIPSCCSSDCCCSGQPSRYTSRSTPCKCSSGRSTALHHCQLQHYHAVAIKPSKSRQLAASRRRQHVCTTHLLTQLCLCIPQPLQGKRVAPH